MSFGAAPRLTQQGQRALMKSFDGAALDFPNGKFLLGSGYQPGLPAWGMAGMLQPVAEVPITSVLRQTINPAGGDNADAGYSFVRLRGIIPVGLLPDNFLVGELGVKVMSNFADPEEGEVDTPILFSYAGADDPEVYRMRGNSLNAEVIDIFMMISDDAQINLTPDLGMVAATLFDIDEAIDAHDNNPDAHVPLTKKIKAWAQGLIEATSTALQNLSNAFSAHRSSKQEHGLTALLTPDGNPIIGNPHRTKLGDMMFRENFFQQGDPNGAWFLRGWTDGYILHYHGYVKNLDFPGGTGGNTRRRTVYFPIPFADSHYFAGAVTWSGSESVSISSKSPGQMTVELYIGGRDIDTEWQAWGLAVPISQIPESPPDIPPPTIPLQPMPTPVSPEYQDGTAWLRMVMNDGTTYGNWYDANGQIFYYREDTQLFYNYLLYPSPIALPGENGAVIYARFERNDRSFYTVDQPSERLFWGSGYFYTLSGRGTTGIAVPHEFLASSWVDNGNGTWSLVISVGDPSVTYHVSGDIVDTNGQNMFASHTTANGMVTITHGAPFDGTVFVEAVASGGV